MATGGNRSKRSCRRSASGTLIEPNESIDNALQAAVEWSNDHEFVSPNEIYTNAVGLLFSLTRKSLIDVSFTTLYRRSLKLTWIDILNRERRSLKPNINSVEKCFMINRLIAEYLKDLYKFARQTGELYEEIRMRMSSSVTSPWTLEHFYGQVLSRRNLQCQRRLFHINHDEANKPCSLLTLQSVATSLCSQLLITYQRYPTQENYHNLKQFIPYCFIIVAQPSIPECVAATKYDKSGGDYSAKLFARIICLIEPAAVKQHLILFNVGVTLRPFDHHVDVTGEDQTALEWHERPIVDADEVLKSFYYVKLDSIKLTRTDIRTARPSYSAKLCQLQFHLKIRINVINTEEVFILSSQLFGLCSHAQYYPEFVAKVLLHEVAEMPQSSGTIIQPNILTNYIHRYFTRISGVEVKMHTSQYITEILRMAYDQKREILNVNSSDIYEDIVMKLLSQMELFLDYPFLSMMYHDGLLLGICNSTVDQQLSGTRERPHILLRFNTLPIHKSSENASMRFIVHNGRLTKATFHTKAFVDEMCRLICEANSQRAKNVQLLSETANRNFHEFNLYFDKELFRLHTAASPLKDAYQPLIPILWNTMRIHTDEPQLDSPSLNPEFIPDNLSQSNPSSIDEIQSDSSNATIQTSDEPMIIQTEVIVRHLVEKLSELLARSSTPDDIAATSILLPTLISGDIEQQKELLSRLLQDSFPSKTYVDMSTQTSSSASDNLPSSDIFEHKELRSS